VLVKKLLPNQPVKLTAIDQGLTSSFSSPAQLKRDSLGRFGSLTVADIWMWLRKLLNMEGESPPPILAPGTSIQRLGDHLMDLELSEVDESELTADFRRNLMDCCAADPNIAAMWILWMSIGEAEPELLTLLSLKRLDGTSISTFLQCTSALEGPSCVAAVDDGRPMTTAFYRAEST
jgi:hypothetical protein